MTPTLEHPTIREATPNDIPQILRLIKDLADFEHALDRVEATEDRLRQTINFAPDKDHANPNPEGFSRVRPASCLVLEVPPSSPPRSHHAAAQHQTQPSSSAYEQHGERASARWGLPLC